MSTDAGTNRQSFNQEAVIREIWPASAQYAPARCLRLQNRAMDYTDSEGRKWPISHGLLYDAQSVPEAARSIGPDWRKTLGCSALHDEQIRTAGPENERLGDLAESRYGRDDLASQWRAADWLWWDSLGTRPDISPEKRSASWLGVRIGSIRRARKRIGMDAWWGEIVWTWREAWSKNRAKLIGSFVWGLVSFRWLREKLGGDS